jgi:hypothetical protein
VNSYWMCGIGRFDYHWIEGDRRVRQPALRRGDRAAPWADALVAVVAVDAAGGAGAARLLISGTRRSELRPQAFATSTAA